jgi:hypothetical protein
MPASYWIGELLRDRRVILTLKESHTGLPLTETVLTLPGVDSLDDRDRQPHKIINAAGFHPEGALGR